MKQLLSLLLFVLSLSGGTACASWTIAWDANDPSENVVSYYIYEHVNGSYELAGAIPANPTPTYVINWLMEGTHYFVVTAVSAYGESSYSNEIKIEASNPKPAPLPPET